MTAAFVVRAIRLCIRRFGWSSGRARRLAQEIEMRTRELAEQNRQLADLNEKLRLASFTDSLTGLWNRRFLATQITEELALIHRAYARGDAPSSGSDLLFMMLDLDGLKAVNDTWGHAAGDSTLVQVEQLLRRVSRQSDTLIRWGGDEFLILGRHTDQPSAQLMAERIRQAVQAHSFEIGDNRSVRMSCSVGFAFYPFVQTAPLLLSWEQVVGLADRGLYLAKQGGRNTWVGVFSRSTTQPQTLVRRLDEDLMRLSDEGLVDLCMPNAAQPLPRTAQPDAGTFAPVSSLRMLKD